MHGLRASTIQNEQLILNWNCNQCDYSNSGNLLEKVAFIEEEYTSEGCRPDIALFDEEKNLLAVIEIVVTHMPEESALEYYEENGIVLIQIELSSEEDLNIVEERITNPDIVDLCLRPKCPNYDKNRIARRILSHFGRCGRCYHQVERYDIVIDSVFGKQVSRNFTDSEIELVKSKRHNIRIGTDETKKEKYPYSVCLYCQRARNRYKRSRF